MKSGCLGFIFGLILLLLTDGILWWQIKQCLKKKWQKTIYLFQALFFIILLMLFQYFVDKVQGPTGYFWIEKIIGLLVLVYSPKVIYIFFNGIGKLLPQRDRRFNIFQRTGNAFSLILFFFLLYSLTWGRYQYRLERINIPVQQLPTTFQNFTIVQLSDLHLGSFGENYIGIDRLVKEVNALKPDLIVFTGDMVNNFSSELLPWIEKLQKLKAKYGKYAVTGNHDYGDYSNWNNPQEKEKNLKYFYKYMEKAGFYMLNNANIPLVIQKDTLWLAGVENWGKPPFPQYGNLNKALQGISKKYPIILLTHDPFHWKAEVLTHPIFLTLSGHTHAMQMGFEMRNIKWSPAQYIYPEYDGLYQQGNQYLYVSRGQGYLGFPGRIGMQPIITLFTLKNNSH